MWDVYGIYPTTPKFPAKLLNENGPDRIAGYGSEKPVIKKTGDAMNNSQPNVNPTSAGAVHVRY